MFTFAFTIGLLVPLGWVVLNGPQPALLEIAGGGAALCWLAAKGQLLALHRVIPFFSAGLLYAACGYIAADRNHLVMYSHQMALLLLFYGLPVGLCLRRLAEGKNGDSVAKALIVFAIVMSLVSLFILRLPEVQRITGETKGVFQRTNGEYDQVIVYLRYFKISNIIIGVIPFTLFALAALPLALTSRSVFLRMLVCVAVGVAVYANVLIATRTALLAAAMSSAVLLLLASPRLPRRRWLTFAGILGGAVTLCGVYFSRNMDRFDYLLHRFTEAGSDGRIAIWAEAYGLLQRYPAGQAAGRLQSHSWAHNLFMDVGLTNGWIAIAAVTVMFACAYYNVARRLLDRDFFRVGPHVVILGWLLSTSLAGMIQPPQPAFLAVLHLACAYFAPVRPTALPNPRMAGDNLTTACLAS